MKWQGEGAAGEDGSEKPETKKREFGQERKGVWDAWNDLELVEKALAESAGMDTIFSPLFVNLIYSYFPNRRHSGSNCNPHFN